MPTAEKAMKGRDCTQSSTPLLQTVVIWWCLVCVFFPPYACRQATVWGFEVVSAVLFKPVASPRLCSRFITRPRRATAACERAPYVSRVFGEEPEPVLPFFLSPVSFPRGHFFSPRKVSFTAAEICVFADNSHAWSSVSKNVGLTVTCSDMTVTCSDLTVTCDDLTVTCSDMTVTLSLIHI